MSLFYLQNMYLDLCLPLCQKRKEQAKFLLSLRCAKYLEFHVHHPRYHLAVWISSTGVTAQEVWFEYLAFLPTNLSYLICSKNY